MFVFVLTGTTQYLEYLDETFAEHKMSSRESASVERMVTIMDTFNTYTVWIDGDDGNETNIAFRLGIEVSDYQRYYQDQCLIFLHSDSRGVIKGNDFPPKEAIDVILSNRGENYWQKMFGDTQG